MVVLTFLPVLSGFCILRTTVSVYPDMDIGWDYDIGWEYGVFHTQVAHLSSLGIWMTLSVVCLTLLTMIISLSQALEEGFNYRQILFSLGALAYIAQTSYFIYNKWVWSLSMPVQFLFALPITALIPHTLFQARFIFANLTCLKDRDSQVHPRWLAILSVLFNLTMILHLLTIIAAHDSTYDPFSDILFMFESLYRLSAVVSFSRLVYFHKTGQQPVEEPLKWDKSIDSMHTDATQGQEFVGQSLPLNLRNHETELVVGNEIPLRPSHACTLSAYPSLEVGI